MTGTSLARSYLSKESDTNKRVDVRLITQLDQFYGGAFSTLSLAPTPTPFMVGDGVNDNNDASDLHAGSDDL